ncbi:carboxypeptidase-like regulatory domain-containing protein [Candidatus Latescibacterota bacterium]
MYGIKTFLILILLAVTILPGCDKKSTVEPEKIEFADITVIVKDEFDRPVVNATIITDPPTQEVVSDEQGRAVFENIPVQGYYFIFREDFTIRKKIYRSFEKNIEDVIMIVKSIAPNIEILLPRSDNFVSSFNSRFVCDGTDLEDGVLPDSAFVWYSDIEGEIGRGREFILNDLTLEEHTITLRARDSDNKVVSKSITIFVVDYHPDSYFPLPTGAQWIYRHPNSSFTVDDETWELKEINITIDEDDRRICIMNYNASAGTRKKVYQYTVIDEFEKKDGNIYVNKTTEQLIIRDKYKKQLDIETIYTPYYVLLKNPMDPLQESSYENDVRLDVVWQYDVETFSETFFVKINTFVEKEETIKIGNNTFTAIPVTITQNTFMRNWWLVPGVGIVKLQYNSFAITPSAELSYTNLYQYYEGETRSRIAKTAPGTNINVLSDHYAPDVIAYHPVTTFNLNATNEPERLRELCNFLRCFAPR